jgi:hypothetical protein
VPDKLPEAFAPTGPRLSKFPIRPAPPIKPHLFPDEARFALRLAVLVGATEFAAWAWLAAAGRGRQVLAFAGLRLLKPLWARLGTRVPRPAIALALLCAAALALGASVLTFPQLVLAQIAVGLPALADLGASCIADSVTIERRAAAYAWLDLAQALGAATGLAVGAAFAGAEVPWSIAALLLAAIGVSALRDRGTPRSAWPAGAYLSALATPLGKQLTATAFACGLLAGPGAALWQPGIRGGLDLAAPHWPAAVLPLAGMVIAARLEPLMPNAMWLPRGAVVLGVAGRLVGWPPAALPILGVAVGMMFGAIPAAVARGAGELERPLASSLAWSALIAGAALGAVL